MNFHDLILVLFFVFCLLGAVCMHHLKKFIFGKQSANWQGYAFPWRWFLPPLILNYLVLLPSILKRFSLLSCATENAIGQFPLGKDVTIYWLLVGSPLLLTTVLQIYDNKFLSSSKILLQRTRTIFLNLATAIAISLLILASAGNRLFSSSWPCQMEGTRDAQPH